MKKLKIILLAFFFISSALFSKEDLEKVRLQLKWLHQFQFAGYYAAKEKGFYEDEGLDVEFVERDSQKTLYENIENGKADYGVSDSGLILEAKKGKEYVVLMQIFQHNPMILASRKSSGIISPYELAGKKIMLTGMESENAPIYAMLIDTIKDLNKVEIINKDYDMDRLADGEVDAASGYMTKFPEELAVKGIDINIINPQNYGIDFYGDNLFTNKKELRNNPRRVEKMIRASKKGWEYALKHKDEIIDLIRKKYNSKLSYEKLKNEADTIQKMMVSDIVEIGTISEERYEIILDYYAKLNLVSDNKVPENYIYIKALNNELKRYEKLGIDYLIKSWKEDESKYESSGDFTKKQLQWIEKNRVLTFIINDKLMPLSFRNSENSNIIGMNVDIIRLIGDKIGVKINFEAADKKNALEELKNRNIDGAVVLGKDIKDSEIRYTDDYIHYTQGIMIREDSDINFFEDLRGRKIGMVGNQENESSIKNVYMDNEIIFSDDIYDLTDKLLAKEIDAVFYNSLELNMFLSKNIIDGVKRAFKIYDDHMGYSYVAVNAEDDTFFKIWNKGVELVSAVEKREIEKRWIENEIKKYINSKDKKIYLNREERDWIRKHKEIKMGFYSEFEPVVIKEENGNLKGIFVDYVNELEKRLGFKIEIIVDSSKNLRDMYEKREIDGILATSQKRINYKSSIKTKPHFNYNYAIYEKVTKPQNIKSLSDLKGKRVATIKNFSELDNLLQEKIEDAEIIYTDTVIEAFRMVLEEKADVVFLMGVHGYYIWKYGLSGIRLGYLETGIQEEAVMDVRSDWKPLVDILNKGIASFSEFDLVHIAEKWLNYNKDITRGKLSEEEMKYLKLKTSIKLALDSSFIKNGKINKDDFRIDYLDLLGEEAGIGMEYSILNNKESNDADGIVKEEYSEKDKEDYLITDLLTNYPLALLAGKTTELKVLSDMKNKKIAVKNGSGYEDYLRKNYPDIKIVKVQGIMEALRFLQNQRVDAVFDSFVLLKELLRNNSDRRLKIFVLGEKDPYRTLKAAVKKNEKELLKILNKAISLVGTDERDEIESKWFKEKRENINLSAEEREWLNKNKIVRVGAYYYFKPIEYQDKNGRLKGISIDYLKKIEDILNIRFEIRGDDSWKGLIDDIKENRIDMISSIAKTKKRGKDFNFTEPYIDTSVAIFAPENITYISNLKELNGKIVAIVDEFALVEWLERDYPEIKIKKVSSIDEGILALRKREADAYLDGFAYASYYLKDSKATDIKVAGETEYRYKISFGVRKDWDIFTAIMKKAMNAIDQNEKDEIYNKYFSIKYDYGIDYTLLWRILIVVIPFLILIVHWNLRLEKEIAKRKEIQEELEKSNEALIIYKKFSEASSQGVGMSELNGEVAYMNPSLMNLEGLEGLKEKNRGNFLDFYTKESQEKLKSFIIPSVFEGESWEGELAHIHRDGTIINTYEHYYTIRDDRGRPLKIAAAISDITEQKKVEKTLKEAHEKAEAANRAKSLFLANMSHEIRTPMNAIIGLGNLIMKTDLSAKQKDYIKRIKKASENLLGIINDILDFSKIEAGKIKLEKTVFNINEIINNIYNILHYRINEKKLKFCIELDKNIPEILLGDPLRLNQIILNLANNAVKFTKNGKVCIKTELLEKSEDRCKIKVAVIDTGIGMSEKIRRSLFKAFTQADESTTRKYGGTGLGLAISKDLVELMGGEIAVISEKGRGSEFYFIVEFEVYDSDKSNRKQIKKDIKDLKIAVVEDNETDLELLKSYLDYIKLHHKDFMPNEKGISEFLKSHEEDNYDIIFVDWKLKDMDGMELIKRLNESSKADLIKVLMTSYDIDELKIRGDEFGINYYLKKPISQSEFYNTIIKMISQENKIIEKDEFFKTVQKQGLEKIKGANILIVEDNEVNQMIIYEFLDDEGFNVSLANNGEEALDLLDEGYRPEIILMDLHMPVMDGYEASKKIRESDRYEELPIIALTADAVSGVHANVLKHGMNDYITKPIDNVKLLEILLKWISPEKRYKQKEHKKDKKINLNIPEIDGIDCEEGLLRISNNKKAYLNVLEKYYNNNKEIIVKIRDAFENDEAEKLVKLIHGLKGVSGNIGAKHYFELLYKMETSLKEEKTFDELEDFLQNIEKEHEKIMSSILSKIINNKELIKTEKKEIESLDEVFDELEKRLKEFNVKAKDSFEIIYSHLESGEYENELLKIKNAIERYDYDKAAENLEKLRERINI